MPITVCVALSAVLLPWAISADNGGHVQVPSSYEPQPGLVPARTDDVGAVRQHRLMRSEQAKPFDHIFAEHPLSHSSFTEDVVVEDYVGQVEGDRRQQEQEPLVPHRQQLQRTKLDPTIASLLDTEVASFLAMKAAAQARLKVQIEAAAGITLMNVEKGSVQSVLSDMTAKNERLAAKVLWGATPGVVAAMTKATKAPPTGSTDKAISGDGSGKQQGPLHRSIVKATRKCLQEVKDLDSSTIDVNASKASGRRKAGQCLYDVLYRFISSGSPLQDALAVLSERDAQNAGPSTSSLIQTRWFGRRRFGRIGTQIEDTQKAATEALSGAIDVVKPVAGSVLKPMKNSRQKAVKQDMKFVNTVLGGASGLWGTVIAAVNNSVDSCDNVLSAVGSGSQSGFDSLGACRKKAEKGTKLVASEAQVLAADGSAGLKALGATLGEGKGVASDALSSLRQVAQSISDIAGDEVQHIADGANNNGVDDMAAKLDAVNDWVDEKSDTLDEELGELEDHETTTTTTSTTSTTTTTTPTTASTTALTTSTTSTTTAGRKALELGAQNNSSNTSTTDATTTTTTSTVGSKPSGAFRAEAVFGLPIAVTLSGTILLSI